MLAFSANWIHESSAFLKIDMIVVVSWRYEFVVLKNLSSQFKIAALLLTWLWSVFRSQRKSPWYVAKLPKKFVPRFDAARRRGNPTQPKSWVSSSPPGMRWYEVWTSPIQFQSSDTLLHKSRAPTHNKGIAASSSCNFPYYYVKNRNVVQLKMTGDVFPILFLYINGD